MLFDWEQVTPCFSSSFFFFFWNTLTFNYQTVFLVFVIITIIIVIIFLCLTSAPILVSVAAVFVFKHSCPSFFRIRVTREAGSSFSTGPQHTQWWVFFFHFCSRVVFPSTFIFSLHTHGREKLKKKKKEKKEKKRKREFFFSPPFSCFFSFFFFVFRKVVDSISFFFFIFSHTCTPASRARKHVYQQQKKHAIVVGVVK